MVDSRSRADFNTRYSFDCDFDEIQLTHLINFTRGINVTSQRKRAIKSQYTKKRKRTESAEISRYRANVTIINAIFILAIFNKKIQFVEHF